jgi:hypothetical protein
MPTIFCCLDTRSDLFDRSALKEEEAELVAMGEQANPPLPSASIESMPFSNPLTGWVGV